MRLLAVTAIALTAGVIAATHQAVAVSNTAVPEAARMSRTVGWPHKPNVREANQVARYVARKAGAGADTTIVRCVNLIPSNAALWGCRVTVKVTVDEVTGKRLNRPRVYRFNVTVNVWEDGSAMYRYQ